MDQAEVTNSDDIDLRPKRRRIVRIVLFVLLGLLLYGGWWLKNESARQQALIDAQKAREGGDFSDVELTGDHPLDQILPIVDGLIEDATAQIVDYTATLERTELIGDKLVGPQTMVVKVRHDSGKNTQNSSPFSVYVRFNSPKSLQGREVIWVEGANDGRMIVHEVGLLGFKRHVVKPDSLIAMFGSRYPVTDTGVIVLLQKLANIGRKDRSERSKDDVDVEIIDGVSSVGVQCKRFRLIHHEKAHEFDFHIAEVDLDMVRKIPVRYAAFGWPGESGEPVLIEEYKYSDVEINVGLGDLDFDPDNPAYQFPE
jgi:hypothetical protein